MTYIRLEDAYVTMHFPHLEKSGKLCIGHFKFENYMYKTI